MLSGNGTIDYDVEAHTLDAHKTSAARQESTTRNLHFLSQQSNTHWWLVFTAYGITSITGVTYANTAHYILLGKILNMKPMVVMLGPV